MEATWQESKKELLAYFLPQEAMMAPAKHRPKKKKISNFFKNYKLRLARPFLASSALSLLNEARALNDFGS